MCDLGRGRLGRRTIRRWSDCDSRNAYSTVIYTLSEMGNSTLGRRAVLQSTGGVIALGGISGVVGASSGSTKEVTGKLQTSDGDPVAGRKVYVGGDGGSEYVTTESDGQFTTKVSGNKIYLGLYKSTPDQLIAPVRNGVPHIDEIGTYSVDSGSRDLGVIDVKRGYLVKLRGLHEDGSPATDAEFGFRADGFGPGRNWYRTDSAGYAVIDGADFRGIELARSAKLKIGVPGADGSVRTYSRYINVYGPLTVTAKVGSGLSIERGESDMSSTSTTTATETTTASTTERTTEATKTSTTEAETITQTTESSTTTQNRTQKTTSASSENATDSIEQLPNRGFFSNGESAGDYAFVTNPFTLTVGGFALSVLGVLQNMIRGK